MKIPRLTDTEKRVAARLRSRIRKKGGWVPNSLIREMAVEVSAMFEYSNRSNEGDFLAPGQAFWYIKGRELVYSTYSPGRHADLPKKFSTWKEASKERDRLNLAS